MESVEQLTDRQLQIEQLVLDGLSNLEIANICHITEGTVKTHVQTILQKRDIEGGRCVLMAREIKRLYRETQDLLEIIKELEKELAAIKAIRTIEHSPSYGAKPCA